MTATYGTGERAGLVARLEDARRHATIYGYGPFGFLASTADADQGGIEIAGLSLAGESGRRAVEATTRLSRTARYDTSFRDVGLAVPEQVRHLTDPAELTSETTRLPELSRTAAFPDGTTLGIALGPDPVWGLKAPIASETTLATGGRTRVTRTSYAPAGGLGAGGSFTRTTTFNGRPYVTVYDAEARTLATTTPEGRTSTATLDDHGDVTRIQTGNLAPVELSYDPATGLLRALRRGDRRTELEYDDNRFLKNRTSWIDALATTRTERINDSLGRARTLALPDTRVVAFAYDANGNVEALAPPGRDAHRFSFTALDDVATYVPPAAGDSGATTAYTYNEDHQLRLITRPDNSAIGFTYGSTSGLLTAIDLPSGRMELGYAAGTGKLERVVGPDGVTLEYGYRGALPVRTAWTGAVSGTVARDFDDDFRVTSENVNGGSAISFGYDGDGLLTSAGALALARDPESGLVTATSFGSVADTITHNAYGEVTGYAAAAAGSELYAVTYARDGLGRITGRTETVLGETTEWSYAYHPAGGLAEVRQDGALYASYAFDQNGNRLSAARAAGGTEAGTYDGRDRLTAYGEHSFAYTANGELREKSGPEGATRYEYDALGALRRVELADGRTIEYAIDGLGRRVGKKVDGVLVRAWLYSDALTLVAELDGAGNVVSRFVPGGMVRGGASYRIVTDHLGSPRLVVNAETGEVAQRMDFDEYGRVLLDTSPGFTPFGFAGGLYDADTGLVRFGARDYDPETGRWTARDPILFQGGQANLYAYVGNDALNLVDRSGLMVPEPAGGYNWGGYYDPVMSLPPAGVFGSFVEGVAIGALSAGAVALGAAGIVAVGVPGSIVTAGLLVFGGFGYGVVGVSIYLNPSPENIAYNVGGLVGGAIVGGAAARPLACRLSAPGHEPLPGRAGWNLRNEWRMRWRLGGELPAWRMGETGPSQIGNTLTIGGMGGYVLGGDEAADLITP
ncbi:MAG: RHS repeat protein [Candidatus Schekmanbacteria bacterium]|nr:RHS repeat protein [Candidatus Schekmanbacteria bacterium]